MNRICSCVCIWILYGTAWPEEDDGSCPGFAASNAKSKASDFFHKRSISSSEVKILTAMPAKMHGYMCMCVICSFQLFASESVPPWQSIIANCIWHSYSWSLWHERLHAHRKLDWLCHRHSATQMQHKCLANTNATQSRYECHKCLANAMIATQPNA